MVTAIFQRGKIAVDMALSTRFAANVVWMDERQERPREQFGPKSTAHDRLQEWVEHGCLEKAWACLLAEYDGEIGLQWEWQAAD